MNQQLHAFGFDVSQTKYSHEIVHMACYINGRSLARVGITINAIAPGYINTETVQTVPKEVAGKEHPADDPDRTVGRTGGDRTLRGVSCLGRRRPDHRLTLTANGGQYITQT